MKRDEYIRRFLDELTQAVNRRVVMVKVDDGFSPRSLEITFEDGSKLEVEARSTLPEDPPELSIDFIPSKPEEEA